MRMIDRFRLARARQRFMQPRASHTGILAAAATLLALSVVAVTVLEHRGGGRELAIADYVRARQLDPMAAIDEGFRTHRWLLLGDIAGAAAPKAFAADVIAFLARGPGLDVVALEVGSDLQPFIDRYLEAEPEDAGPLLTNPRTLRQMDGNTSAYLGLYRRVWHLNRELAADRRIRIVAMDEPGWPPERALSPARLLPVLEQREQHMLEAIDGRIIRRDESAAILFFVDGLHTLRADLRLETGGAVSRTSPLLAARLQAYRPGRVFSVIVDASPTGAPVLYIPALRPGRLYQLTRRSAANSPLGLPLTRDFPALASDLAIASPPGLDVAITPSDTRLSAIADLYVRVPW
jgi:hypothetical protein